MPTCSGGQLPCDVSGLCLSVACPSGWTWDPATCSCHRDCSSPGPTPTTAHVYPNANGGVFFSAGPPCPPPDPTPFGLANPVACSTVAYDPIGPPCKKSQTWCDGSNADCATKATAIYGPQTYTCSFSCTDPRFPPSAGFCWCDCSYPVCPGGYDYDPTCGDCRPHTTVCPPGYTWNAGAQYCEHGPCPSGQCWCQAGGACVNCSPSPPCAAQRSCAWSELTCAWDCTTPSCPPGQTFSMATCDCETGPPGIDLLETEGGWIFRSYQDGAGNVIVERTRNAGVTWE